MSVLSDLIADQLVSPRNRGILAGSAALLLGGCAAKLASMFRVSDGLARLAGVGVVGVLGLTWWPTISVAATDVLSTTTSITTSVTGESYGFTSSCDVLTAEQVASLLYVAGFRDEDLVHLTAIAKRESGYRPAAHRSDRDKSLVIGDRGLFQINYIHDDNLRSAGIITSASDLFDPLVNARAAYFLFQRSGLFPWNMTSGGWQAHGVPFHGTNVDAARAAVQRAGEQGLLTGELAEYERQTAACGTEAVQ